jgi:recombination protein RecA
MAKKNNVEQQASFKEEALKVAILAIEKAQGKGSIITGNSESIPGVEFFSTGSTSIDSILGGGWARRRIHEVIGPPSSGKTTILLHAIAEIQKLGETATFIDAEHAVDTGYAAALGVDLSKLLISQPDSGEQALDIIETLTKSGAVSLIVIDSVASLVPRAELEGQMGASHIGLQARLMSQAMRKLTAICSKTGTTIIFINQIRMKVGVMYGSPETTSGGEALKFYASQRLDVRRRAPVKEGQDTVASETHIKCIKNKVHPPFKECDVQIRFGQGIDILTDLLNAALAKDIIQRAGAWYSYEGTNIGQGTSGARQFLIEHPDKAEEIKQKVLQHL